MAELVINLDELNLRELFDIRHQRTRDGVKCAIRLAIPREVNVQSSVRKDKSAIACKAVEYETKSLISFHVAGTLEELVDYRSDAIFRGEAKARHSDLVGKLTCN